MANAINVLVSSCELKLYSYFFQNKPYHLLQTDILKTKDLTPYRVTEVSTVPIAIPLLLPISTGDMIEI
jgi:hypothetical protein